MTAPRSSVQVTIANGTSSDLSVYDDADFSVNYFLIAAGYERLISVGGVGVWNQGWKKGDHVAYVESAVGGVVVLIWA